MRLEVLVFTGLSWKQRHENFPLSKLHGIKHMLEVYDVLISDLLIPDLSYSRPGPPLHGKPGLFYNIYVVLGTHIVGSIGSFRTERLHSMDFHSTWVARRSLRYLIPGQRICHLLEVVFGHEGG